MGGPRPEPRSDHARRAGHEYLDYFEVAVYQRRLETNPNLTGIQQRKASEEFAALVKGKRTVTKVKVTEVTLREKDGAYTVFGSVNPQGDCLVAASFHPKGPFGERVSKLSKGDEIVIEGQLRLEFGHTPGLDLAKILK